MTGDVREEKLRRGECVLGVHDHAPGGPCGYPTTTRRRSPAISSRAAGMQLPMVARADAETAGTAAALERVDEIVSVAAIDAVFTGSTDRGNSLGVLGQPEHPLLLAAQERTSSAALNASKTLGILVANEEAARRWIDRGARYRCFLFENVLVRRGAGLVDILRRAARST